ncbi:MAG: hypothetical protein NT009_13855 [Proteobacteria bacterium]|nr:hypothetical protein [Pseudomonadota bacterium]
MKKNIYFKIALSGILLVSIGAFMSFGVSLYHDLQIKRKIAEITPSFRGAKNLYLIKLTRENSGQHFFSLDDYKITPGIDGPYAYVSDLPVYLKDGEGKTKGFLSYWGYDEKHGNWELVRVGRISEGKAKNDENK